MKKGDVLIHFIPNRKQWQWMYFTKDADNTGDSGEELNTFLTSADTGKSSFGTKEEAIADVKKYVEKSHLMLGNILEEPGSIETV